MVLCVSDNGTDFNKWFLLRTEAYRLQFPGLYKGGIYAYPHAVIDGDYMYIIYSKHKEATDVMRIALKDIV